MKLSEAFRDAGFWFRVGDYQFRFTCPCGAALELDKCPLSTREDVTVYSCPHCGADIAGVALDDTSAHVFPGDAANPEGHRMCGHIFGTTVDMELWPAAAAEPFLRIQRRPAFFTSRGLGPQRPQAS